MNRRRARACGIVGVSQRLAYLVLATALCVGSARADEEGKGPKAQAPALTTERWLALPAVYYDAERGFGFSAAVLRLFRVDAQNDADDRSSQLRFTTSVSLSGDVDLSVDPTLSLWGGGLVLEGYGSLSRRTLSYWGIGADSDDVFMDYTRRQGRMQLAALTGMRHNFFAGLSYDLRGVEVSDTSGGDLLHEPGVLGAKGSLLSGVGAVLRYDSRSSAYSPSSGTYVEILPRVYHGWLGSEFDNVFLYVDARHFVPVGRFHVLAAQAIAWLQRGDIPFDRLSTAGGGRMLRGMDSGRVRDKHFVGAQLEYRAPLYWRFGGVAFAGIGRVARTVTSFDFSYWKAAAGVGVRFAVDPKQRLNLRGDVAISNDSYGVYLDVLEAF